MTEALTPEERSQLEDLFDQVSQMPADEHAAFVDAACAGKPGLRSQLLRLLSGLQGEDRLAAFRPATPTRIGERIGPYQLLEKVGVGGMGEVYAAQQLEPVRRKVAIKLIKAGMDSRQVVFRFEAERQTLAMMDHPNMAKVLDGGSTAAGEPYFVMEFIEGVPILEYCDAQRLDTKARLRLFVDVCHAIQHAHQKGIIHRDIKPSNVQVAVHDGAPLPKVIDFGIAKAIRSDAAEGETLTQHRQLVGTPAYMSPEQAGGTARDIDTRSDIYSLGVLLYELLTGAAPFDEDVLSQGRLDEIVQVICEQTPHKPSTRISSLGAETDATATRRRVGGRRLASDLRGDLDWIVMKCLEKERGRRYETASALAADIESHLRDRPVAAGPPSNVYRLRKFVRRNRALVVAAALVVMVLILGAGGTTWGMLLALDEKERADAEAGKAGRAAAEEKAARTAEARRAAQLQQVADFQSVQMASVDAMTMGARLRQELIDAVDGERRDELAAAIKGINFTSIALHALEHDLFGPSLAAIDAQFEDQPTVQAQLLGAFGKATRDAGLDDLAVEPIERAYEIWLRERGSEDAHTVEAQNSVAVARFDQGRYAEAEAIARQAVAGLRHLLGDDHPNTLNALDCLGDAQKQLGRLGEAEACYREVLAGRLERLGPDAALTLESTRTLGAVLREQGRYDEAKTLLVEALARHRANTEEDDRLTLTILNSIAVLYHEQRRFDRAETCHREALAGARRLLGDDHPITLSSMSNRSAVLIELNEFEEAEALGRESVARHRAVFGDDHPRTWLAVADLGAVYAEMTRFQDALPLLQEAYLGQRAHKSEDPGRWASTLNNLGLTLRRYGRAAEALPILEEGLLETGRLRGDDNPQRLVALTNLAGVRKDLGDLEQAERDYREILAIRSRLDAGGPLTLLAMANLALLLQKRDQLDEAWELLERALARQRESLGDDHIDTLFTLHYCGGLLSARGELDAAERHARQAVDGFRRQLPRTFPALLSALNNLGRILQGLKRLPEAEACLAESLNGLRRVYPPGHGFTVATCLNLGLVLMAAERHDEATKYLREAVDGFTELGDEKSAAKARAKLAEAERASGSTGR